MRFHSAVFRNYGLSFSQYTVEAITDAGLRNKVKIMIGGGTVTDEVSIYFSGTDTYGGDAVAPVNLSKSWVKHFHCFSWYSR